MSRSHLSTTRLHVTVSTVIVMHGHITVQMLSAMCSVGISRFSYLLVNRSIPHTHPHTIHVTCFITLLTHQVSHCSLTRVHMNLYVSHNKNKEMTTRGAIAALLTAARASLTCKGSPAAARAPRTRASPGPRGARPPPRSARGTPAALGRTGTRTS